MVTQTSLTNLNDAEWQLLPPRTPQTATSHALRTAVNALLYVLRTGGAWRLLPPLAASVSPGQQQKRSH
jgi:transposase